MHAHAERGDDQRQALEPAMFLQVLIDLRRRHFLQGAQQVMGQLAQAVADRSHALRGNAALDALRPLLKS